jgi:Porin subfamily
VSGATAASLATVAYGTNDIGASRSRDLIAMLRIDQVWGLFQASLAAHDNHAAYYGVDETTGHQGDKWGWAAQLALSLKNIPTGDTINLSAAYTNGATRYNFNDLMATTYAMYGGTGPASGYQSVGLAGLSDSVFVADAGQELTTPTASVVATPITGIHSGNAAIYGAWAAVRHGSTAKGYICSAFVTGLALSSGMTGCNPDFDYGVVGLVTRLTPIRNLTFTADLAYTMLDQKYASASTVTLPLLSAVAKPAATYALKDQSTLTLLLRAQRNW